MATDQPHIDALMQRGVAAHQAGRGDEAAAYYRDVLARRPGFPDAHHLLGLLEYQAGRLEPAEAEVLRALAGRPDDAMFWFNLGNIQRAAGKTADALHAFARAHQLHPSLAGAAANMGNLLSAGQRYREAFGWFNRALQSDERDTIALNGLGCCLRHLGQVAEAEAAFRRAADLAPHDPTPWFNLVGLLADSGRSADALALIERLRPACAGDPARLREQGLVLGQLGRYEASIEYLRAALTLRPDDTSARAGLATALLETWQHDAAWPEFDALTQTPRIDPLCWQRVVMSHLYFGRTTPEAMLALHRRYHDLLPDSGPPPELDRRAPAGRRRIGFLSADFRRHACAHFLLPLLEHLDRSEVEVFLYSNTRQADAVTGRLRAAGEHWRDLRGLAPADVAALILADRLDILIDLAGYTDGNALAVFARRVAPVQVTWLGYPASTGLRQMDYRISDDLADPPGDSDRHCSERLLRVADGFLCYAPIFPVPERGPDDGQTRPLTFGSFNNLVKITPQALALWVDIVTAVPGARLVLKSRQLDQPTVRERVAAFAEAHGLPRDRLRLDGWLPAERHLASYCAVDIALDPFPYSGTTTTCETLLMGVPLVTLAGATHVSRVSAALLSRVGCGELVAGDLADYRRIAIALAHDAPARARYREQLPERFKQSPMFDGAGFARRFLAVLPGPGH